MISPLRFIFLLFAFVIASGWLIPSNIGLYLSLAINQVIIIAGLPILIVKIAGKSLGFNLKTPPPMFMAAAFFSALAIAVISGYLIAATEYITNVPLAISAATRKIMEEPTIREFLLQVVFIALLPPLCEEIFFRGICQTAISARYGNRLGIIITACFFTVVHWDCQIRFYQLGCLDRLVKGHNKSSRDR